MCKCVLDDVIQGLAHEHISVDIERCSGSRHQPYKSRHISDETIKRPSSDFKSASVTEEAKAATTEP